MVSVCGPLVWVKHVSAGWMIMFLLPVRVIYFPSNFQVCRGVVPSRTSVFSSKTWLHRETLPIKTATLLHLLVSLNCLGN